MVDDTSQEADFITIVSSEMIADVMQDYFNKHMYKKKVAIVDLKPTESGYMFSLSFTAPIQQQSVAKVDPFSQLLQETQHNNGTVRDKKGKFTSGNSKQTVKG